MENTERLQQDSQGMTLCPEEYVLIQNQDSSCIPTHTGNCEDALPPLCHTILFSFYPKVDSLACKGECGMGYYYSTRFGQAGGL